MSEFERINSKEQLYEVYTCSGNRIMIKGVQTILVDYSVDNITFINAAGEQIASFTLMNIEGWRVAP